MTSGSTFRVNFAMTVSYDVLRKNICSVRNIGNLVKPGRQVDSFPENDDGPSFLKVPLPLVVSREALLNFPEEGYFGASSLLAETARAPEQNRTRSPTCKGVSVHGKSMEKGSAVRGCQIILKVPQNVESV